MNELIKITDRTIGASAIQTINARDLHAFLGVRKDFSEWIRAQLERAKLVQNRDFLVFTQKGEKPQGGRPTTEYALSLDAAKHVSMMSGAEKGPEVREYFIECERRAKAAPSFDVMTALSDPAWLRGALGAYTEKVIALEGRVSELAPKADALDRIASAQGSMCITDCAKALQIRPKQLFNFMRSHGWLYRRDGVELGYQDKVNAGYLHHKTVTIDRDGIKETRVQVRVTPKGLTVLARKFPFAVLSAA